MSSVSALLAPPADIDFWEPDSWDAQEDSAPAHLSAVDDQRDAAASEDRKAVEVEFTVLADELAGAALGLSSTRRAMRHPAYLGIMALGDDAIPLLLERLRRGNNRPIWLRLLGSITTFQPGHGQETVADAADAWVRWGRREGRIT